MLISVIFLFCFWLCKVFFLVTHKAFHICVDDQLLYKKPFILLDVFIYKLHCDMQSKINVQCVVHTYTTYQLYSVRDELQWIQHPIVVSLHAIDLKHHFMCCICSCSDWVLYGNLNLLLQYFIVCDPFTVALQFLNVLSLLWQW